MFKGAEELRVHYRKNHHVCDKAECFMLVFEDAVTLSEHYLVTHKVRKEAKLQFGFQGDSDEEEKKRTRVHI